jgi:hypothetical protein
MTSNRKSIQDLVDTLIRLLNRRVICEHEAIANLLDDVAFDIARFGSSGQTDELLEIIPELPATAQTELQDFVCGSDDRIFCRNVFYTPAENPPDGHPPFGQRADVDYSATPIAIVIHCSDGSTFEIPPDDPYCMVVFAVRKHFDPNFDHTRNAG